MASPLQGVPKHCAARLLLTALSPSKAMLWRGISISHSCKLKSLHVLCSSLATISKAYGKRKCLQEQERKVWEKTAVVTLLAFLSHKLSCRFLQNNSLFYPCVTHSWRTEFSVKTSCMLTWAGRAFTQNSWTRERQSCSSPPGPPGSAPAWVASAPSPIPFVSSGSILCSLWHQAVLPTFRCSAGCSVWTGCCCLVSFLPRLSASPDGLRSWNPHMNTSVSSTTLILLLDSQVGPVTPEESQGWPCTPSTFSV